MTKIKICGITILKDALFSIELGADALGFNFVKQSSRYLTPDKAQFITRKLPAGVNKVGVFVNEPIVDVVEAAELASLDSIQLHGDETPEYVSNLRMLTDLEIIKAFRVNHAFDQHIVTTYGLDAVLLDAFSPHELGGSGTTFDWEIARRTTLLIPKLYLAGGLTPDNVGLAISIVKPFAVDVCSGVEAEKGKKDSQKLRKFIAEART
ncbi:MAG: phosphoribosylanthranilate isomerase [Pyrinomonadaceae bacterium]